MSDIKWSKVRAGNYVSEVINDRQYEATKVGSGWIVFVHSEHGSDVQTDGRTLTECKRNVATYLDAHANDDRFPAGQLVWNTNTNQYAKVAKDSTRSASDALIEYLPGHNQPCDTIWASKSTLVPQTNVTPASAFVADPDNPTDFELAAALDRGLADGSLIDSADWLAEQRAKDAADEAEVVRVLTEGARPAKPAGRDTSDRCAVCHREAHRPGLRNGNHGHDYVAPTPAEPVGACHCDELPTPHLVGEHTVIITGGVNILDRQSATYTPPTVTDIIGTVNGGYTVYRALLGASNTIYVAAQNHKGHTATWFVFETWDHRAGFNAGNYWYTSDASDNLAKANDDLVARALGA
jgi:hypothetical protein